MLIGFGRSKLGFPGNGLVWLVKLVGVGERSWLVLVRKVGWVWVKKLVGFG